MQEFEMLCEGYMEVKIMYRDEITDKDSLG